MKTKKEEIASEKFMEYEKSIVNHPNYQGMPDAIRDDGTIQWEAPSNRGPGKYQFTHDKRLDWWKEKAAAVYIDINTSKWISKTAKTIHPTKLHPCKVCGKIMDIRYCYLTKNLIDRIERLSFYNGALELSQETHIKDFLTDFYDLYKEQALESIPSLLKCRRFQDIPCYKTIGDYLKWIDEQYIPAEPPLLSPGCMSNAPDRLDGFHTYNICCRAKRDTGRTKENLSSYSTDRRAFENWSDGNWALANRLMGYISANNENPDYYCKNSTIEITHNPPYTPDHIGPISLGFSHIPIFQILCKSCNSAKNNRMTLSDVKILRYLESKGTSIVTWYAKPIWDKCKDKVIDNNTAGILSRIMRDNRNFALLLLNELLEDDNHLFLITLLNLGYADTKYTITKSPVSECIATAIYLEEQEDNSYAFEKKVRKIRVSFDSISEFAAKENRNCFQIQSKDICEKKEELKQLLNQIDETLIKQNNSLKKEYEKIDNKAMNISEIVEPQNYKRLLEEYFFVEAKKKLFEIMSEYANVLEGMWDDPRFKR